MIIRREKKASINISFNLKPYIRINHKIKGPIYFLIHSDMHIIIITIIIYVNFDLLGYSNLMLLNQIKWEKLSKSE
jgi:hypothetical protein